MTEHAPIHAQPPFLEFLNRKFFSLLEIHQEKSHTAGVKLSSPSFCLPLLNKFTFQDVLPRHVKSDGHVKLHCLWATRRHVCARAPTCTRMHVWVPHQETSWLSCHALALGTSAESPFASAQILASPLRLRLRVLQRSWQASFGNICIYLNVPRRWRDFNTIQHIKMHNSNIKVLPIRLNDRDGY